MRPCVFNGVLALGCVLSACVAATRVQANENLPEPNDRYLTVRQSLLAMYALGYMTGPANAVAEQFPFNRLNPNVREYVRFYLERDNARDTNIYGAICLLGFVGNKEDIPFIEQYIEESIARLSGVRGGRTLTLKNLSLHVGHFAGMMVMRDIDGSELFLKKYAKVSSWMPPGEEPTPESVSNAGSLYRSFVVGAYQFSKAPYLLPLLQERAPDLTPYFSDWTVNSLKNMGTDRYTELMSHKGVSQEKLDKMFTEYRERYGEWLDMLLRKQTFAQWREAHEKQKAAASAEAQPVGSFENIDMSETVEGRYVKAVARDAVAAFEQVSRTLLDGNAGDAPIKKEVLQHIQRAGLNSYDGFQITIDVEARVDGLSPASGHGQGDGETDETKPAVVEKRRSAAVTFRIEGTADILKRYIPDAGPNAPVSPTTGDLMIEVKRTGDTWRWGSVSRVGVQAGADVVEDEYLIDSLRAAMRAYTRISGAIIDGNYDMMTIPVVDDGELIPLEKRKKDTDEMAEALDMEKRVLQELMNARLNTYGDQHIKIRFQATLNHNGTSGGTGTTSPGVEGHEVANVTFTIRNGAEAYRKHAPLQSGNDGVDDAGGLRVWMKRINGTWYWNPFGW